jgi:hypothetical protein
VLDEATTALEGETEAATSAAIFSIEGDVATILDDHRLSAVGYTDGVLYLSFRKSVGFGTFDQVREQVPELVRQAELLGLESTSALPTSELHTKHLQKPHCMNHRGIVSQPSGAVIVAACRGATCSAEGLDSPAHMAKVECDKICL